MRHIVLWLGLGALVFWMVGCTPPVNPLPTLAPTLVDPTTVQATPSLQPPTPTTHLTDGPTSVPTVTTAPARPTATRIVTLAPLSVTRSSGATTITITVEQLNEALSRRFQTEPLPDYAGPPIATFETGLLRLALVIAPPNTTTPQALTLTLTVGALPTTTGSVLDVHAISLSALNGVRTLQVKKAQALLQMTLADLAERAAGASTIAYNSVSVSADGIVMTVSVP